MSEIVLALGGGGTKGISHIGVLKVFERENIKIKAVAGTSAGGIVGAAIAAGLTSADIESFLQKTNKLGNLFHRSPSDAPSLIGLSGFTEAFKDLLQDKTFDDLIMPFACTAVDQESSQEIILNKGKVIDAVLATIAIPGIFPPQRIHDHILVDGGVLDPVPVTLARWLMPSYPVVAVCLTPSPEKWAELGHAKIKPPIAIPGPILNQFYRLRLAQAFQTFTNSMDITARMLAELRLQNDRPDIIIRPEVSSYGLLDSADPAEIIRLGEIAAEGALADIKRVSSLPRRLIRRIKRTELPGKAI
ncbi:MAG: patatin-like phospholipase family protein [Anaerolineaceae bacterium]|nr:patatin-like phospholipase family protein [Anaerolineaceae bacterium]